MFDRPSRCRLEKALSSAAEDEGSATWGQLWGQCVVAWGLPLVKSCRDGGIYRSPYCIQDDRKTPTCWARSRCSERVSTAIAIRLRDRTDGAWTTRGW